jgi:hypothetical protein
MRAALVNGWKVCHVVAESEGCLLVGGEGMKYLAARRAGRDWGALGCEGFSLVSGSRLAAVLAPLEVVLQTGGSARGV